MPLTTDVMIFYGKLKGVTNNDNVIKLLDIYMYCLNQVEKGNMLNKIILVHSGIWLNF